MTTTEELAEFVQEVSAEEFSEDTQTELKKRVLDSVGIGINALGAEPVEVVHQTVQRANPGDDCTLWGRGETASPVGAAMHNTALTRYLDFMDSFLAPGETPHPSDNIGAVVAAAEVVDASGEELLEGIGVAYEVQGELAWNAPVRDKGWDHVTHTVLSAVCGVAKVLDLDVETTRDAIGIAGTAHNALRVTRTGGINEWKGIASANAARNAVYAALLASDGMEGPKDLFEGQKGWKQTISGEFEVDLDPGCTRVHDVMTKRYVAETYAQSAVEGVIELAEQEDLDGSNVKLIDLETFAGAKLIIGGGEGDRHTVETKAQADHSLPYMLAAALLDREMGNTQYEPDRIIQDDVQYLLRHVTVEEDEEFTEQFEAGEMPARVTVELNDGTTHVVEKDAFQGHPTNPMSWNQVETKFHDTAGTRLDKDRRDDIVATVKDLESTTVTDLVTLLAQDVV
ncbi:MmgE/PrpD family protein [Halopiger xanaduensis]|uniref:2-methylcitrate dehydratase n=1 Tax=Halopiger xanaduensis (strain DSM 18323 / JCM 14033 / SH-6) TaxID=797210 RepID=F8DE26_HALXS|nr:MmgE/PrpD family protein [Halopiger xanaduensis]AEH39302.1 2-methylcitrate dehydratase [Halopiger xanaduensis SH-6]